MLDTKLVVKIPSNCQDERRYVIAVLLGEFLGLNYEMQVTPELESVDISLDGKVLKIIDCFFQSAKNDWLLPGSLPVMPLDIWRTPEEFSKINLVSRSVPVLFGKKLEGKYYNKVSEKEINLCLDVFGSSFFMLSRYEELVVRERDSHGRFSALSSIAFKERFLERPIVNEYLEILWFCMKKQWPKLNRKRRSFNLFLTHDVDRPFYYLYRSPLQTAISYAGDLIKRRNFVNANLRLSDWFSVHRGNVERDPFNKFDYLMDVSERNNVKSAFYFLSHRSGAKVDADYNIESRPIKNLLSKVHSRGHEIGLHGSYYSYNSTEQLVKEKNRIESVLGQLAIDQQIRGVRQHYLRWDSLNSPSNIEALKVEYDTTLSYADYSGFRCGVCYPFPMYDFKNRKALKTYERPLIVMECSVMDESYMGVSTKEEALNYILKLYNRCRLFGGEFVLLWHNSQFRTAEEREIYESILDY